MKLRLLFIAILFAKIGLGQDSTNLSLEEAIDLAKESEEYSQPVTVNPKIISEKLGYVSEPINGQRFDRTKWKEVVGTKDYDETESNSRKRKKEKNDSKQKDESSGSDVQSDKSKMRIERKNYDESDTDSESDEPEPLSIALGPFTSIILKFGFYALVIGIISYILFIIFKNVSIKSKVKVSESNNIDPANAIEDIKELEIDRLLREAKSSNNYRLIIRIYFLGLLKKLDEKGHISWKRDKTNREYLTELFAKKHFFDEVKHLTRVYEEVWYGEHVYPTHVYDQVISSFKVVDDKLNDSKTL